MVEALSIDVISDVVCPWCFIGKRRLEAALKLYAEKHPDKAAPIVAWHPFQLNPDMPAEGITRAEYIERKFGSRGYPHERLEKIGDEVGIPFAFDKIPRQPNTLAAHSLIQWAAQRGDQAAMKEALMNAYFIEGADLTRDDTLLDIAVDAGLKREEAAACLSNPEVRGLVAEEEENARQIGVQGVPFFIFNRKFAVSGAQEPEALLEAMEQAEAEAT